MIPNRIRRFTAELKAEVALAALTERQPLAELAARYQLTVAQISHWKLQLRQQAAQVFAPAAGSAAAPSPDLEPLYAAIGKLQIENQLLKKCSGRYQRRATRLGASRCRRQRGDPLPGCGPSPQQLLLPPAGRKRAEAAAY